MEINLQDWKNMTPQAFSFATVSNNGSIYVPPYGLNDVIDYMIKIDPVTYNVTKIPLVVDNSTEKWQYGTAIGDKIIFLPYNESRILIVNTTNDSVEYVNLGVEGKGKYIKAHVHNNTIVSLPYGEHEEFDYAVSFNVDTYEVKLQLIETPVKDQKKWHTSQVVQGILHAVPRGENWTRPYFPYRIEMNCETLEYKLFDMSHLWADYDAEECTNKKYTTLAKVGNNLWAPPYSENDNFDVMLKFINGEWVHERTGMQSTSRKHYSHTVAKNDKIYFPPAGHEEEWSELLIIDSKTDTWKTVTLGLGKESKKYFTGWENSKGKLYYIPRGGCVCMPRDTWKCWGDLAEVLVIDTKDDSFYTVDISEHFTDNTSIEKYNSSVIVNDKIFAMPYGQSESFQTVLVFDTITETVVHTIDLNNIYEL